MFSKTKNTLHKRRIEILTNRIKDLEQANKLLVKENQSLKAYTENQQMSLDELMSQMNKIQDAYGDAIEEAKKVRIEYKKLIVDTIAEQKAFAQK